LKNQKTKIENYTFNCSEKWGSLHNSETKKLMLRFVSHFFAKPFGRSYFILSLKSKLQSKHFTESLSILYVTPKYFNIWSSNFSVNTLPIRLYVPVFSLSQLMS